MKPFALITRHPRMVLFAGYLKYFVPLLNTLYLKFVKYFHDILKNSKINQMPQLRTPIPANLALIHAYTHGMGVLIWSITAKWL